MFLKYFLDKLNLSFFLCKPPNNQKILEFTFKALIDDEKLVDFESFIIIKLSFL